MPENNDVIHAPDAAVRVDRLANVDGQFVLRVVSPQDFTSDSGILYVHYTRGLSPGWRPVWFTATDLQDLRASIDATLQDR